MKTNEVCEHLARLNADELRLVAAHLYKMLPRKMASDKGADRLLADPAGFLQAGKVKQAPELPELEMVDFETKEFLDNAAQDRYFAPNRIIPKSERSRWRFVAKRLYRDWCHLATQPENRTAVATALENLYRTLCRGSQVYLFPSTAPFQAIKVPRHNFFEQLFLIKAQLHSANEWISEAMLLMVDVKSGESTDAEMHGAFISLLKTAELKELALQIVTSQIGKFPPASRATEFSDQSWTRKCLLRLGFQITWALGEKERSVEWLRAFVSGEKSGEHFVLQLLLETKDREFWTSTYETTRLHHPSAVTSWDKTYEQAKLQGKLPAWQVG